MEDTQISTETQTAPVAVESPKKERFAVRDVSTGREPQPEVKPENKPAIDPKDNEQAPEKLNENKRKYDSRYEQEYARMTRQKYRHLDEIKALREENAKLKNQTSSQFTEDNFASKEAFEQWKKTNEQAPEHTDYEAEEAVETFNESLRERYKDPAKLQEYVTMVQQNKPLLDRIDKDSQTFIMSSPAGVDMLEFFLRNPNMIVRLTKEHPYKRPAVLNALEAHFLNASGQNQVQEPSKPVEEKKPVGIVSNGKAPTSSSPKSANDILKDLRNNRLKK